MENQNVVVATKQTKKATFATRAKQSAAAIAASTYAIVSQAALDVTPLETEIKSNGASVETIMLTVLTLIALFVGYKLIRRAMA